MDALNRDGRYTLKYMKTEQGEVEYFSDCLPNFLVRALVGLKDANETVIAITSLMDFVDARYQSDYEYELACKTIEQLSYEDTRIILSIGPNKHIHEELELPDWFVSVLNELIQSGRKLRAIVAVRNYTLERWQITVGLKEAKDYVQMLESML